MNHSAEIVAKGAVLLSRKWPAGASVSIEEVDNELRKEFGDQAPCGKTRAAILAACGLILIRRPTCTRKPAGDRNRWEARLIVLEHQVVNITKWILQEWGADLNSEPDSAVAQNVRPITVVGRVVKPEEGNVVGLGALFEVCRQCGVRFSSSIEQEIKPKLPVLFQKQTSRGPVNCYSVKECLPIVREVVAQAAVARKRSRELSFG